MNKFTHQYWTNAGSDKISNEITGDITNDINHDITNELTKDINKGHDLKWKYSLIDVDELCGFVTTTAKEIYQTLGPGLPVCVYQLKLFNDLTKKGLSLRSGKSMLGSCDEDKTRAETERVQNLIIVNDVLVIEYIASTNMSEKCKETIKSDLKNNNFAMGLLINISEKENNIEVKHIHQNYIAH